MSNPGKSLASLLKDLYVFRGLSNGEIDKILAVARTVELEPEQSLSLEEDQHTPLSIVVSGRVRQEIPAAREAAKPHILKAGEFFGADFYFYGKLQPVKVVALVPTQLLFIDISSLQWLIEEIPALKNRLKAASDMYHLIRNRHFHWINEDEVTQLIARKHMAYLFVSLIPPVLVGWVAVAFFAGAFLVDQASFRMALEWFGFGVLFTAAIYGFWQFLDWGNDYYVITNQRVVWLEQVIGIYDSRQEAPLIAVKANEVRTGLIGRWLGYGDVIINTFMGRVRFRHVASPNELKALVDQVQLQAYAQISQADTEAMEKVIRQKIEPPVESEAPEITEPTPIAKSMKPSVSYRKRLVNYFKTRVEEGQVITYRKHYFILLRKTWLSGLLQIAAVALPILVIVGMRNKPDVEGRGMLILITGIAGFVALVIASLWWLYQYVDWRNDIYQITADRIIDSEKKPLGTELIKSAPLGNIQSMDYERRGLLGVLLNMGNVVINVGTETKFTFDGVHDPARAQQDVFNRMVAFQRKKQLDEASKQWEQVSDWLAAYHRQAEDLRQNPKKQDTETNIG